MPLILGANSVSGGYEIDNSLRFNSGSSDYLSRTFSSAGNRRTWTISCWIKRTNISTSEKSFFANYTSSSNLGNLYFRSGDDLQYYNENLSVATTYKTPINKLRDVSAWYHYVFRCDTTDATSSNRYRHYFNGVLFNTTFAEDLAPSQNYDTEINKAIAHYIGYNGNSGGYFSGYLADYYFIDGQALDPTSFGETDEDSGIWKPKAYTGTYGTNGFYLEFQNSGALGTDSSGNGNTFTVNNLTSIDQTTDTPTNNFATMNPLDQTSITSVTNGNLTVTTNGTVSSNIRGTFAVSSGKWYWEVKCVSFDTAGTWMIGVADITTLISSSTWSSANAWSYYGANGEKYNSGSSSAYGATYTTNDIISVLLDMNNGTLIFYKNGVSQGTAFSTGLTGKLITPVIGSGLYSVVVDFNFGSPPFTISSGNADANGIGNFEYSVPSGYLALCTANLATNG